MLERIKASLPSLAPAEQRVGKLCLADPRAFAKLPVSELADRAHVSKPTVVRFCRSVGYDGLSDFKLKLAGTVNEGVPFIHRSVDADDKTADVMVKVIDNTVAAFLKYRNDASSMAIEKAVNALVDTYNSGRQIQFFGVGNSGVVALDAQHKFFRLGINTNAYSDGHMQVMSASILGAAANSDIIKYTAPAMGGLTLSASLTENTGGKQLTVTPGTPASATAASGLAALGDGMEAGQQRAITIGGDYAAGALAAKLDMSSWSEGAADNRYRVAASYDFGAAKVGFGYEDAKTKAGVSTKQTMLGVSAPIGGALTVGAAFARNDKSDANKVREGFTYGLSYSLSKRTSFNVNMTSWDDAAGYADKFTKTWMALDHTF